MIEKRKLLNTYTPKMSARQQYINIMTGLFAAEEDMTEQEIDEYLKEEGYDLDELDKKGKALFKRLQRSKPA